MEPIKPNFLIIGAAKCGTTTLAKILDFHPQVCVGKPKEVGFFQDCSDFQINKNYFKGWEWYKKAFSHYAGEQLVGEATPAYSDGSRSPSTAKRVYQFNPEMKIIFMVRCPLQKQISAWKMQYYEGMNRINKHRIETKWAVKGFDFWLKKQREVGQWDVCKYYFQQEKYQEIFPPNQVYVTFLEDWKLNQGKEVEKIFRFLNLETPLSSDELFIKENTEGGRLITRSFFKNFNDPIIWPYLRKIIPRRLRTFLSAKLVLTKFHYPEFNSNSDMVNEFLKYVAEDNFLFLQHNSKSSDFWQTQKY